MGSGGRTFRTLRSSRSSGSSSWPDTEVKREMYERHFVGRVFGVIDDRASVVAMWRSLDLTVVQVAEGAF
ncbi:phosphatase domain-containing protein [Spongiactinospora rosea]